MSRPDPSTKALGCGLIVLLAAVVMAGAAVCAVERDQRGKLTQEERHESLSNVADGFHRGTLRRNQSDNATEILPLEFADPPHPEAGYVYDLTQSAIAIPHGMAGGVGRVAWCESRFNAAAVGAHGEVGQLQIHPLHFPRMYRQGLNPGSDRDLVLYAVQLWIQQGWTPWAGCRP